MMFVRRALAIVFLLGAYVAGAQTISTVSTITDTDGQTWNNGTYSISFITPGQNQTVTYNNTILSRVPITGTLSGSGVLAATLYNTNTLAPTGTQYSFTLCPQASVPCSTVIIPVTTTNLSAGLSAGITVPRFPANGLTFGYLDGEVVTTPQPGGSYFNVTNGVSRIWSGSAWINGTGGGAPTGAAGGGLSGTYPNPSVTTLAATGGTINNVVIGGITQAVGSFTTVNATAITSNGNVTINNGLATINNNGGTAGNSSLFIVPTDDSASTKEAYGTNHANAAYVWWINDDGSSTWPKNTTTLGILPYTLYSAAGTALPTCAVGLNGETTTVSDATSPTYMGAYTSGGAITTAVICSYNGTTYAWKTH